MYFPRFDFSFGKSYSDALSRGWNDYETLSKFSGFNILGIIPRYRMGEMQAQENTRYWSDFARHTGVRLGDIKYPIRSRIFSDYQYYGNAFQSVSGNVTRLYHFGRPVNHYHEHFTNINNYGDYHKYDVENGYFD